MREIILDKLKEILYDDCLRAKLYLRVIKEQFDYPYFKERLEFHRKHGDPECLREWLCNYVFRNRLNTLVLHPICLHHRGKIEAKKPL